MYAADTPFHVNCQRYENIINPVSVLVKGEIDHTTKNKRCYKVILQPVATLFRIKEKICLICFLFIICDIHKIHFWSVLHAADVATVTTY
jgi:hypothetical protein